MFLAQKLLSTFLGENYLYRVMSTRKIYLTAQFVVSDFICAWENCGMYWRVYIQLSAYSSFYQPHPKDEGR